MKSFHFGIKYVIVVTKALMISLTCRYAPYLSDLINDYDTPCFSDIAIYVQDLNKLSLWPWSYTLRLLNKCNLSESSILKYCWS